MFEKNPTRQTFIIFSLLLLLLFLLLLLLLLAWVTLVYTHIQMHTHMYRCIHKCTSVWRAEVDVNCSLPHFPGPGSFVDLATVAGVFVSLALGSQVHTCRCPASHVHTQLHSKHFTETSSQLPLINLCNKDTEAEYISHGLSEEVSWEVMSAKYS